MKRRYTAATAARGGGGDGGRKVNEEFQSDGGWIFWEQ
jgi:hypothetical protein